MKKLTDRLKGYPSYSYIGIVSIAMIITSLIKNDAIYLIYAFALSIILHICNKGSVEMKSNHRNDLNVIWLIPAAFFLGLSLASHIKYLYTLVGLVFAAIYLIKEYL